MKPEMTSGEIADNIPLHIDICENNNCEEARKTIQEARSKQWLSKDFVMKCIDKMGARYQKFNFLKEELKQKLEEGGK